MQERFIMDLQQIMNLLDYGLLMIDQSGRVLSCNRAAEDLLQVAHKDLIGTYAADIIPHFHGQETVVIHGRSIRVISNPVMDQEKWMGTICLLVETESIASITSELDERLRQYSELYSLLECSHDGIWIMDKTGVTLFVNESYEKLSGLKKNVLIGRNVHDMVEEGMFSQSAAAEAIQTGKPATIIQRIESKNKYVMVTASPVFGKKGLQYIVSNVRDITEIVLLKKELEAAKERNQQMKHEMEQWNHGEATDIIAHSPALKKIMKLCKDLAHFDSTLLILGESGVGKEVVAQAFHQFSRRKEKPMIKVNCGAIPQNLMESELFGFEKGAFTGASSSKKGMFELAQGGTIFLDEIAEMPLSLQVKLLRVIQQKEMMRVGGTIPIALDVRVIAATNGDLKQMVQEGLFREDLYFRLHVIPVYIPPLRERKEDIIPLIYFFIRKFKNKYNKELDMRSLQMDPLLQYHWPGNIRELENTIERWVAFNGDIPLLAQQSFFPKGISLFDSVPLSEEAGLKGNLEAYERNIIMETLLRNRSIRESARQLEISHTTLLRKMKKYDIPVERDMC